jgi:hypothetical protein
MDIGSSGVESWKCVCVRARVFCSMYAIDSTVVLVCHSFVPKLACVAFVLM